MILTLVLTGCAAKRSMPPAGPKYPSTLCGILCELYEELQLFKMKEKFHLLGFTDESPYNPWYERLQSIIGVKNEPTEVNDAARALCMLGLAYRQEQGNENALTQALNRQIQASLMQLRTLENEKRAAKGAGTLNNDREYDQDNTNATSRGAQP
ncbi:MAG: hypothetical protein EOM25_11575 [Deltaproteobacteria bacterium]|nr:hypothetical protein [Deltaproteobacteria bacterium]